MDSEISPISEARRIGATNDLDMVNSDMVGAWTSQCIFSAAASKDSYEVCFSRQTALAIVHHTPLCWSPCRQHFQETSTSTNPMCPLPFGCLVSARRSQTSTHLMAPKRRLNGAKSQRLRIQASKLHQSHLYKMQISRSLRHSGHFLREVENTLSKKAEWLWTQSELLLGIHHYFFSQHHRHRHNTIDTERDVPTTPTLRRTTPSRLPDSSRAADERVGISLYCCILENGWGNPASEMLSRDTFHFPWKRKFSFFSL